MITALQKSQKMEKQTLQAFWTALKTLARKLDINVTGTQAQDKIPYRTRSYKEKKKKKKMLIEIILLEAA